MLRLAVLLVLWLVATQAFGQTFDHSVLDGLLNKHVTRDGWVDYRGLKREVRELDRYLDSLDKADLSTLPRDEQLPCESTPTTPAPCG